MRAYAVRCLENSAPERVAFFLPQLVQALRADADGQLAAFLLRTAAASDVFAHQLVWALQTEQEPPPEAFAPEVKRSGWQPPRDYGLWQAAKALRQRVLDGLSPAARGFWEAEAAYFDRVTEISGVLKRLDPDARKSRVVEELSAFAAADPRLYLPTSPHCRVKAHIPASGTPMQSAAKARRPAARRPAAHAHASFPTQSKAATFAAP